MVKYDIFFDEEFERIFRDISRSFAGLGGGLEEATFGGHAGPVYGCTLTVGPDGRPVVRQYGSAVPREAEDDALVDTIVDEKEKAVRLVAEMPGVEKSDFAVVIDDGVVSIDAERGTKKYHARVPIRHKVDPNSARALYKNGILELTFKSLEPEKPAGKTVEVL